MKNCLLLASVIATASGASAAVTYTGVPYTQNFDTLASSGLDTLFTDDSTLPGWTAYSGDSGYTNSGPFPFSINPVGTATADAYDADTGSANAGELYSYGSAGSSERALGSLASGSSFDFFLALQVTNGTTQALSSFTLQYDGEQWRRGNNATQRAESILFYYRIGGTALDSTGTWTSVGSLDFVSPDISAAAAAALDGNANKVTLSQTVSASLNPGESIWLVWVDPDNAGTDHGMAIDNVSLSFVPEPGSALLAGAAASLALLRRRRA